MRHRIQLPACALSFLLLFVAVRPGSQAVAQSRASQSFKPPATAVSTIENMSAAVCPVVYQLDDSPGTRGYHYIFYGNAFFINRDGYLLTAAHVLSEFHNGGQPSILVRLASAPPRLLKTEVVATDLEHDVAILRAIPNPFNGPYTVAALPLAEEKPAVGEDVEASALRPEHSKSPHTFELPVAETYFATVVDYRSVALDPDPQPSIPLMTTPSNDSETLSNHRATPAKSSAQLPYDESAASNSSAPRSLGRSQIRTDLFLFSHEVQRGQSGAPVTSMTTHKVVGIIEGRWLHPVARVVPQRAKNAPASGPVSTATPANSALPKFEPANSVPPPPALTQGAAVPITYALTLLKKNHIAWNSPPVL
jgi:hypothetical protein